MTRYLLMLALMSANAAIGGTVSVLPSTVTATVGQTVTVDVQIQSITDLYAYQFDFSFTPGILRGESITEGGVLASAGATFFFPAQIDNTTGDAFGTLDSLQGPVPGASGSGQLARLSFTALAPGTTSIHVFNALLLDSSLGDLTVNIADGAVTVTPTPEPASGVVVSIVCLLAVALRGRVLPSSYR